MRLKKSKFKPYELASLAPWTLPRYTATERCSGGVNAPVLESISAPAWTEMVSSRIFRAQWVISRWAACSECQWQRPPDHSLQRTGERAAPPGPG